MRVSASFQLHYMMALHRLAHGSGGGGMSYTPANSDDW